MTSFFNKEPDHAVPPTRHTYQPAAPAVDRRHEHATFLTRNAAQLSPRHRRLATFLGRSPDTATADDLRRFQIEQQQDGVPVPTMNSIVSALRFFFTQTLDRPDLARRLVRLAHPRNLPVVLSRDEVARLLNATTCLKHQAALSVAYGAGLRVAEVSMLKVADVDAERMDINRTNHTNAPIFVFIHGGTWRYDTARGYAYAAETFVGAGAHYVAVDFTSVTDVGGDLGVLAMQVRKAIGWVYRNAASFGGDPDRLYIGGHSSGGHLCAVALITEWQKGFGLPADIIKGGLCMSGMYEMEPVRLSWRRGYIKFTDEIADNMSPQRHVKRLGAPVVVTYGSLETPEFRRQGRDFAATAKAAGKPVELIEATNYHHHEMAETLGNPYGPNGRAALALMGIGAA
jgi:arylformamidase